MTREGASSMTNEVNEAIKRIAGDYNIPYANLRAVVEVESAGRTSALVNGRAEPLIRWEGHYFDRRLSGEQRARARQLGLASPKVGGVKNPRNQEDRWNELLLPAAKINKDAAYESCSWGLGQVMGSHWKAFGYSGVVDLVTKARSGIQGQIQLMLRYCVVNNLIDELQRGDFTAFARAYNGPGYKKNRYDEKMRELAKKYAGDVGGSVVHPEYKEDTNLVKMGDKGLRVRELQALLLRAGYAIKIDGDFGPATKKAVIEFQSLFGLPADGIVGPVTWRTLDEYRIDPEEQPGKVSPTEAVTETPEGRQGALAAFIGILVAALSSLTPEAQEALVAGIGAAITALGGLWAAYGWHNVNKTE